MATIAQTFATAFQYHQAGNLPQAEWLYRQILQADPGHADAWCLLGAARQAQGQFAEAESCLRRAIQLAPLHPNAQNYLGTVLAQQGRFDEAAACLEQQLRNQPADAEAFNNLGLVRAEQGRWPDAVGRYRQAVRLQPNWAEAYGNLALALNQLGKLDEAVATYRQALRLKPDFAQAHSNLGNALLSQDKPDEAALHCRQALALWPDFPEAHNNLGNALRSVGKLDEAVRHLQEALRLRPGFPEAHNNLGNARREQGRLDEALAHFHEALRLKPNYPEAHNNLGNALLEKGQFDDALAHFRHALVLQPDFVEAYNSLGDAHRDRGQWEEAERYFEQALGIEPGFARARGNRSLIWLIRGDFERGWPEYEWRWAQHGIRRPPFSQPLWDGSPLDGRTILLHAEQGLGDTLQFIRYATLVQQRGGKVIVACQPPLVRLLGGAEGIDSLVPQGAALPAFNVHAPLLSLPGILRTTLATIPASVPYLHADAALVERWRRELQPLKGLRVGIAWQGDTAYRGDRKRSIPLAYFTRLAQVPGVQLVSLQKGQGTEQLQSLENKSLVLDLGDRLDEASGPFMDSAAIMKNVDLVITSDTAVAHLAGALAAPVWLALPEVADWRWLLQREDCPWYPTMHLFRQTRAGNWQDVFERMADALREPEHGNQRGNFRSGLAVSPGG